LIKVENISVMNFENAFRGMRNPLASWNQSDSYLENIIGKKDLELALKLIKSGSDHSKFMRQIFVSMDITSPLYWWKEMDQYRVGCTTNSTSTMHTLHKTEITPKLFSVEKLQDHNSLMFENYCKYLEALRQEYIKTKDKNIWDQLIQLLPSSFNQTRTWTADYAVLRNLYHPRRSHKLTEWIGFCNIIEALPYSELITN